MTVRARVYGTLLVWMVLSLALGLAALYLSTAYLILVLVLQIVAAVIVMRTRCPHCGYPVLKRERRTDIGHLTVWVPVVEERCHRCGRPL